MAGEKKVVDASVLAKCFLKEPDSEKALQLVEDHINGKHLMIVPELIFFEVLNAVKYKLKLDPVKLAETGHKLADLQLHVERVNNFLLAKIGELASRYNITVYDAAYIAVAELHNTSVITADEKWSRKGIQVNTL